MRLMPCVLLPLLLAGCAGGGDDFARPGSWQPAGVNAANLQAMLAEPRDALRGAAAPTERAQPGALAVRRLEQDRRQPLAAGNASRIGAAPGPAAGAPAAEPSHAP